MNITTAKPFYFNTRLSLIELLGLKAKNIQELLAGIKKVPRSSVYHHTHRSLHQQQFLYPEPPNDFAYWITNALNLKELGEAMASVNIVRFKTIGELKNQFIKILSDYIIREKSTAMSPEYQEFHFMKCKTFILPTSYIAHGLKEFIEILDRISINSLYFHLIEARLRLEKDENDFSAWFRGLGNKELAKAVARIDPYNMTLQGLRKKIINLVKQYA